MLLFRKRIDKENDERKVKLKALQNEVASFKKTVTLTAEEEDSTLAKCGVNADCSNKAEMVRRCQEFTNSHYHSGKKTKTLKTEFAKQEQAACAANPGTLELMSTSFRRHLKDNVFNPQSYNSAQLENAGTSGLNLNTANLIRRSFGDAGEVGKIMPCSSTIGLYNRYLARKAILFLHSRVRYGSH